MWLYLFLKSVMILGLLFFGQLAFAGIKFAGMYSPMPQINKVLKLVCLLFIFLFLFLFLDTFLGYSDEITGHLPA